MKNLYTLTPESILLLSSSQRILSPLEIDQFGNFLHQLSCQQMSKLKTLISKLTDQKEVSFYIIGSHARKLSKCNSDIDCFIIHDCEKKLALKYRSNIANQIKSLDKIYSIRNPLMIFTPKEFKTKIETLLKSSLPFDSFQLFALMNFGLLYGKNTIPYEIRNNITSKNISKHLRNIILYDLMKKPLFFFSRRSLGAVFNRVYQNYSDALKFKQEKSKVTLSSPDISNNQMAMLDTIFIKEQFKTVSKYKTPYFKTIISLIRLLYQCLLKY